MAVKVIVPSKTYNANYLGVQFLNGVGVFEDEALAKEVAKTLGYQVEAIKAEPKAEPRKATAKKKAPAKKEKE